MEAFAPIVHSGGGCQPHGRILGTEAGGVYSVMGTAGLAPLKISFNLRNDSRQMHCPHTMWGFPGGSDAKESASNSGGLGSVSELGRSPGEGHGNPLQYPSLENPMDRGNLWGPRELDMTE